MIYYQTLLFKARLYRMEGESRGSHFPEELTDANRCPRDPVERAMPWLTEAELRCFLRQFTRDPEEQFMDLQWATERFMEFYRAEPPSSGRLQKEPEPEPAQEVELRMQMDRAERIQVERGSFLAEMGIR